MTKFTLVAGSLTRQKVPPNSSVITIANSSITPVNGIDEEVRKIGGLSLHQSIEKRRKEDRKKGIGYYQLGDAITTHAGDLPMDAVIHSIIKSLDNPSNPFQWREMQTKMSQLRRAFRNIVEEAEKKKFNCLVVPIFCPIGFQLQLAFKIEYLAMKECKINQISEIRFVIEEQKGYEEIKNLIASKELKTFKMPPLMMEKIESKIMAPIQSIRDLALRGHPVEEEESNDTCLFRITGSQTEPLFIKTDLLCVAVNGKLESDSFLQYQMENLLGEEFIQKIDAMRYGEGAPKKFPCGFIMDFKTNKEFKNLQIMVTTEEISLLSFLMPEKKMSIETQKKLHGYYERMMEGASLVHATSMTMPLFEHRDLNTSLIIAIAAALKFASKYGVTKVIYYHPSEGVMNAFYELLGWRKNRSVHSQLFADLLASALSVPDDPIIVNQLSTVLANAWTTTPSKLSYNFDSIQFQTGGSNSPGATIISTEKKDISRSSAPNGAVICASNGRLDYGDGTARALVKAGGEDILRPESESLMDEYEKYSKKPLPAGSATLTGSGNMSNYKCIIHGIGPEVQNHRPTQADYYRLLKTYESIFKIAEIGGCNKLVIPFISTGIFGMDMSTGMKIAFLAVLSYLPSYGISEIVFINKDEKTINEFKTITGRLPLTLRSRHDAIVLLDSRFSNLKLPTDPIIKANIDQEIEKVFDVTKRILGHPVTLSMQVPNKPNVTTTKRRMPPNPPGAIKRAPDVSSISSISSPDLGAISRTSDIPSTDEFSEVRPAIDAEKRKSRISATQDTLSKEKETKNVARRAFSQVDPTEERRKDRERKAEARKRESTLEKELRNERDRRRKQAYRAAAKEAKAEERRKQIADSKSKASEKDKEERRRRERERIASSRTSQRIEHAKDIATKQGEKEDEISNDSAPNIEQSKRDRR